ncbi:hypothetical protein DFH07DRAFT_714418, partial [Mycena maculata]
MAQVVEGIRDAFNKLKRKVHIALRTQMGDADRLAQRSHEVATFLSAAEPHWRLFSSAEFEIIRTSVADMQDALDAAVNQSSDPLTTPLLVVSKKIPNGKGTGRHRIEIDPQFLSGVLQLRGPTGIATSIGCHPRTVRRRAIEQGLAIPAPPVCRREVQEDGTVVKIWQSTGPTIAAISDDPEALDQQVGEILQLFPHFGREMISGALRSRGFRVPRNRIAASYLRFVTHAFIDGKSRLVTGLRVSSNNLGVTVLDVLESAAALYGWPSRLPSGWKRFGAVVGALIFGARDSVHNIRIERLWVDFTRGVGKKWHRFFHELETTYGLH